jgi:hypothetical protein
MVGFTRALWRAPAHEGGNVPRRRAFKAALMKPIENDHAGCIDVATPPRRHRADTASLRWRSRSIRATTVAERSRGVHSSTTAIMVIATHDAFNGSR